MFPFTISFNGNFLVPLLWNLYHKLYHKFCDYNDHVISRFLDSQKYLGQIDGETALVELYNR